MKTRKALEGQVLRLGNTSYSGNKAVGCKLEGAMNPIMRAYLATLPMVKI